MRHILSAAGIVALVFLQAISVEANEVIEISGMKIPVLEGAEQVKETRGVSVKGHVVTFAVDKTLEAVTDFYKAFFEENGFLIIGGMESGENFNAAVKKGNVQFSLRIYRESGRTQIQFIW